MCDVVMKCVSELITLTVRGGPRIKLLIAIDIRDSINICTSNNVKPLMVVLSISNYDL